MSSSYIISRFSKMLRMAIDPRLSWNRFSSDGGWLQSLLGKVSASVLSSSWSIRYYFWKIKLIWFETFKWDSRDSTLIEPSSQVFGMSIWERSWGASHRLGPVSPKVRFGPRSLIKMDTYFFFLLFNWPTIWRIIFQCTGLKFQEYYFVCKLILSSLLWRFQEEHGVL